MARVIVDGKSVVVNKTRAERRENVDVLACVAPDSE